MDWKELGIWSLVFVWIALYVGSYIYLAEREINKHK